MEEGSDSKTIDGMSAKRIAHLPASLKDHSDHPNPARRPMRTLSRWLEMAGVNKILG